MTAQIQRWGGPTQFPFSSATKADGLVYVAGTIVAEGDIRNQTRKVLESIDQTLQKAGSSLANAASLQVYLKSANDFAAMNEVYAGFFPDPPPARTTVEVAALPKGFKVEIEAIARRP